MEKFPLLKKEQVALLRSDLDTGHVLDDRYNLAVDDSQKVYSIFDTLDDALEYTRQLLNNNIKIECTLYDKRGDELYWLLKVPVL